MNKILKLTAFREKNNFAIPLRIGGVINDSFYLLILEYMAKRAVCKPASRIPVICNFRVCIPAKLVLHRY